MPHITFDRYKIDMGAKACDRLLSQFDNSTKGIQVFLGALIEQTQDLNNIELSVMMGRSLENAIGVQLDIIGRIVGIDRPVVDSDDVLWFTFDAGNESQYWDAEAGWWVSTAPTGLFAPVSDSVYRRFIVGKIFKNQVSGATVPEMISFIKIVFNVWSSVTPSVAPVEVMSVDISVENTIDPLYIPILSSVRSDSNVQNEYFLPIPAGVKLNSIIIV